MHANFTLGGLTSETIKRMMILEERLRRWDYLCGRIASDFEIFTTLFLFIFIPFRHFLWITAQLQPPHRLAQQPRNRPSRLLAQPEEYRHLLGSETTARPLIALALRFWHAANILFRFQVQLDPMNRHF